MMAGRSDERRAPDGAWQDGAWHDALGPTGRTVHALDERGTVRDWLVSPAWSAPCDDLEAVLDAAGSPWGPDGRWVLTNGPDVAPLKERLHARRPLVTAQELPEAIEGGPLSWIAPGGGRDTGTWRRVHTAGDGFVDWSGFFHTPVYRHAVAATVLEVDQPEWRTLILASTGPVALWVGPELAGVFTDVGYMDPVEHRVRVRLPSGATCCTVATWQVAFRECRHIVRLRVEGLPVRVVIPSAGADEYAAAIAEQALEQVRAESWALPDGVAHLIGPPGVALQVHVDGAPAPVPVHLLDGRAELPIADASPTPGAGRPVADAIASMLATGETGLTIRVDDERCPVTRRLRVAVLPRARHGRAVGRPEDWRTELLEHVASGPASSARALARIGLDPSAAVSADDLRLGVTMLRTRADCADFEALGLIHLWHRLPADRWPDGMREEVRRTLLDFKYWIDQPGLDAMCYFTENHQLVWHTAELLIGEAFTDETFTNADRTGAEHAAHGREHAVEWMRRRLAGGFSEFDSNAYVAIDCLALASLVEFATDPEVAHLAEALLDKLLLCLAANSWHGIHGTAHGRSYTPMLRSARFEETGPIMWLLWGVGALNSAVLPATVLATATRYVLPPVIRSVAHDRRPAWEGRQVYRGQYRFEHDLLRRPYGSDLRVWRTPHAMLSSVQDYRSGLPGLQEHIWGVTLAPEVQVFATHPPNEVHDASARPNAWAGQRILPRVRQHRDSLLALHAIPRSDPIGGTHLWFPAALADEWRLVGPWLAARVGDGYLGVAVDGGLVPATSGDEAHQVWRPKGDGRAYVVTVGDLPTDGPFDAFVAALREPAFDRVSATPAVTWTARDGRTLALSWTGPFTVDGQAVDLGPDGRPETPPQIDNPACRLAFGDRRLEAALGSERLVLDLARGMRIEPSSGVAPDVG